MNVLWSPLALEILGELAEFISMDNPIAAENWVNDIFDKAEKLSDMPEMGRQVPELSSNNYRELIIGNYRIIYLVDTDIRILTVRNFKQLLKEEYLS